MEDKTLSNESQAVLDEGKKAWLAYFAQIDLKSVRHEL
jgi:hypothetical protein